MTVKTVSKSGLPFGVAKLSRQGFSEHQLPNVRQRQAWHHVSGPVREFTTSMTRQGKDNAGNDLQGKEEDISSVCLLEKIASAPWMFNLPHEPTDRLEKTLILIVQIVSYLIRKDEEQYFTVSRRAFSGALIEI
jgi:hypothetical protein